jgi:hypothetical protein
MFLTKFPFLVRLLTALAVNIDSKLACNVV